MYVPTTAQTTPTIADAASARTKNSYCERIGQGAHGRPSARLVRLVVVLLPRCRRVVMVGVVEQHGLALEDEQVAAVGARQDVGVEHQRGRAIGHDPPVHADHPTEMLRRRGEVVGGGEHGPAAPELRRRGPP